MECLLAGKALSTVQGVSLQAIPSFNTTFHMYQDLIERFWTIAEYSKYRCKHCGETEHVRPRLGGARIAVHILLTCLTYGFWIPVWIFDFALQKSKWACTECGMLRGALHNYKEPAEFKLPHEDAWHKGMGILAVIMVAVAQIATMGSHSDASNGQPQQVPATEAARAQESSAPVASPQQTKAEPHGPMSSAEAWLLLQRDFSAWLTDKDDSRTTFPEVERAQELLARIGTGDPEYAAAAALRKEVSRRRAGWDKAVQETVTLITKKQRQKFVEGLGPIFWKSGLDVEVKGEGKDVTTLRLTYILWSRPLIYQAITRGEILDSAWKLGFKKVIFDNDTHYWTYEAPKDSAGG